MREKRNTCRIFVGNQEGKRHLGIPKCGWVDNIKIDLIGTEWGDTDWIDLAQDRDQLRTLVNTVINLRVP
jgi:hypothetical protein